MDAWGPANLIYQFLMQQYICRVPHCCRGKISANVVIELLAQGSEKQLGLGGPEQLYLGGERNLLHVPQAGCRLSQGTRIPLEDLGPSHHTPGLPKQELPGNTGQTPQALLRSHRLWPQSPSDKEAGGLGWG